MPSLLKCRVPSATHDLGQVLCRRSLFDHLKAFATLVRSDRRTDLEICGLHLCCQADSPPRLFGTLTSAASRTSVRESTYQVLQKAQFLSVFSPSSPTANFSSFHCHAAVGLWLDRPGPSSRLLRGMSYPLDENAAPDSSVVCSQRPIRLVSGAAQQSYLPVCTPSSTTVSLTRHSYTGHFT